jgi:hypothetical protein
VSSSFVARARALVGSWSRRRWLAAIALGVLAVVVLAVVGGYVYYGVLGFHAPADVTSSVRANPNVSVERAYGGFVVRPTAAGAASTRAPGEGVGVVFYPGGRVAPDAYLPSAARIVEETGAVVVVPGMTANLAVLSQGKATAVMDGERGIDRWVVGGHSLGGAMACRYANANPERVDGLLLVGAYCDRPVRGTPALSVVGSRDVVLDRERFRETRGNLPANARIVHVEGMNHSQAGWYYGQPGGQPATVSYATAHDRLAAVVDAWLCRAVVECSGSTNTTVSTVESPRTSRERVASTRESVASVASTRESVASVASTRASGWRAASVAIAIDAVASSVRSGTGWSEATSALMVRSIRTVPDGSWTIRTVTVSPW